MNAALLFTYGRPTVHPAGAIEVAPASTYFALLALPAIVGAAVGGYAGSRVRSNPVAFGVAGGVAGAIAAPVATVAVWRASRSVPTASLPATPTSTP